jgi:hypothetical protein
MGAPLVLGFLVRSAEGLPSTRNWSSRFFALHISIAKATAPLRQAARAPPRSPGWFYAE